jgi:tetratricopeptide (TPR) repeat protein
LLRAEADFAEAAALDPARQNVIQARVAFLIGQGKLAEAENVLVVMHTKAPYQDAILQQLLDVRLRQGKTQEALEILEDLTRRDDQYRNSLVELLTFVEKSKKGKGIEAIQEWMADPETKVLALDVGRRVAERLLVRKSPKSAAIFYRALMDLEPDDFRITLGLAATEMKLGNTAKALAILNRLVARTDVSYELDYERALVLWSILQRKTGHLEVAVKTLSDYVERNPWKVEIRIALADLYHAQNKNTQAKGLLEQGLEATPGDAQLLARRATFYLYDKAPDMAAQYYRQALKEDPRNVEATRGLKELGQQ